MNKNDSHKIALKINSLPGKYRNIGPLILIFPGEILFNLEELSLGKTLGDPIPFINFFNDVFGEKAGLTNILFSPDLLNNLDGLIFILFPIA